MSNARVVFTVLAFVASAPASALCLDPRTGVSGYQVPLEAEVRSATFILVGQIIRGKALHEDPQDPQGVTAYLWTVKPVRQLKGHAARTVVVRVDNDSSQYPMAVGEKHVLFLSGDSHQAAVDSCGSSSVLPRGEVVRAQAEALLLRAPAAP